MADENAQAGSEWDWLEGSGLRLGGALIFARDDEYALSAWEICRVRALTGGDLRRGVSAGDRDCPLVTDVNGPLVARQPSPDLRFLGHGQLLALLRPAARAGLAHWHPHELRHPGASLMLAQGTPLHVVSEVLGHASIAITKDVYGRLLEGDKRAAAESMSRALFGAGHMPVAPRRTKKAPSGSGKGPVTSARSEGLEPPTF